jgi:hypothetical protein
MIINPRADAQNKIREQLFFKIFLITDSTLRPNINLPRRTICAVRSGFTSPNPTTNPLSGGMIESELFNTGVAVLDCGIIGERDCPFEHAERDVDSNVGAGALVTRLSGEVSKAHPSTLE